MPLYIPRQNDFSSKITIRSNQSLARILGCHVILADYPLSDCITHYLESPCKVVRGNVNKKKYGFYFPCFKKSNYDTVEQGEQLQPFMRFFPSLPFKIRVLKSDLNKINKSHEDE